MRKIIWACILTISGCTSDVPGPKALENTYIPLSQGNVWIYEFESNVYGTTSSQNEIYLVKDSISEILDSDGKIEAEIYRFKSQQSEGEWVFTEIWSIGQEEGKVVFRKGNETIVNWVFPPVLKQTWDGYAYMPGASINFELSSFQESYINIAGSEYMAAAEVIHWNNEDKIVEFEFRSEVFAEGIGLIESFDKNYIYCQEPACLGQEEIEEGYDNRYSLIEYSLK